MNRFDTPACRPLDDGLEYPVSVVGLAKLPNRAVRAAPAIFLLLGWITLGAQPLPADYHAADQALAKGELKNGRRLLQKLATTAPTLPRAYERLAQSYVDTGQEPEGITYFRGLLGHDAANAHAGLAMLYNATGKADSALTHGLAAVLGGAPIFPACEITVHLTRSKNSEAALREQLQNRLAEHPKDLAAGYTLAYEAFADGRLEEAHRQISALQKRFPRDWRLFHLRSLIEIEYLPTDAVLLSIQRGLDLATTATDREGMAYMLYRLVYSDLIRRDARKAAVSLKRLKAVGELPGKLTMFTTLAAAMLDRKSGNFEKSIQTLLSLRSQAMQQHDGVLTYLANRTLGKVYLQAVNFGAGEQAIQLAKAIADSLRFSTLQLEGEALLGYAQERLGDYVFTARHYEAAERQAQSLGATQHLPYLWSGLARVAWHRRSYDDAFSLRKKQLAMSRSLGLREMEMDCLTELIRYHLYRSEDDSVSQALDAAFKLSRIYSTPRDLFNLKLLQGDFARKTKNYDKALKAYDEARAIAPLVGTQAITAGSLKIGDLLLKLDKCDDAEQAYRQAYEEVLRRVTEEGPEKGQLDLAISNEVIISLAKGLVLCGKYRDGLEIARQSRLLALRALAVEQERARRAAGDQELALLQQLDSLKFVLAKLADDPSASQRQRMRTKSSIDALTQKLSILRRQTGSASDSLWLDRFLNNPRSLSEFQKSLAEQKAVALIYLVGANTTVAFALHPDTLLARLVRTFERDTLRAVVKRLSPLLGLERSQPSNPAVQSPLQLDLKRSMARALVQTLVDSLLLDRRPEKLIIMPDDALCTLPFDALMRVASGSNVSLDALPRIQIAFDFEDIFPLSPMNSARALIMANSQRVQNNDAGIKPPKLKFAVREAKEIAGLLDGSADLLYDEHATRDSFLVKAPHYDILHLPMHASLSDWSSEYAQMSFGAANGGSAPMYGYEISHMSLQARLAVLSACNTALGDFRPGFGLLSLVLNFVDAGVPAVVATLWQVDEKSTKILMVEFYKQVRNGNWFSEALAGAKQHLIENGYSHPYYWAGFVLYGKDGKVDSMASPPAAAISWWSWWPIFFVLMVVGALLWLWQRQRLGRLRKSNGTMGSETV